MNRRSLLYLVLLPSLLVNLPVNAQKCIHTKLSRQFDYMISVIGPTHTDTSFSITSRKNAKVVLKVYTKHHKKLAQKIILKTDVLLEDAYDNCNNVRSYITSENRNKEAPDNEYGDFIVADLNFDGKEDLAIKYDSGGYPGPICAFYVQPDDMHFKNAVFLSEKMLFFPIDIDSKSKTLTTHAHADAYGYYESIFIYNPKTKKWIRTSHTYRKA